MLILWQNSTDCANWVFDRKKLRAVEILNIDVRANCNYNKNIVDPNRRILILICISRRWVQNFSDRHCIVSCSLTKMLYRLRGKTCQFISRYQIISAFWLENFGAVNSMRLMLETQTRRFLFSALKMKNNPFCSWTSFQKSRCNFWWREEVDGSALQWRKRCTCNFCMHDAQD